MNNDNNDNDNNDNSNNNRNDNSNNGNNNGGGNNGGTRTVRDVFGDFDRSDRVLRDAVGFRCEQILELSRSAGRSQYDFSAERIDECRRQEVLVDTIPGKVKSLPDTGGPPLLLLPWAVALVVAGISVLRRS